MSIFQDERPSPFTLCTMGLFCSFIWVGIVYFFKEIVLLSTLWSLVCGYTLLGLFVWTIHSILYKCECCKKKKEEIEPPDYMETEHRPPPKYEATTEDII